MKTITKINLKKMLGIAALCFGLSSAATAQCHANFTYTVGSSGSVDFTNTSTGTTGSTIYSWNFGTGYNSRSAVESPNFTYTYNGTYYVNMSIWDSVGSCFDSTSQVVTITNGINCNLAASFSYITGNGGLVNFTNTSINAPTGTFLNWDFGDAFNSHSASPSHTYGYNGTYTVSLYALDSTGYCSSTYYDTVTITTADTCALNASFTYTLGSNGLVLLTNTSTGLDSSSQSNWSYGYNWTSVSGQPAIGNQPVIQYVANGTYNITLSYGDSVSACHSSSSQTISITNVTAAPTPTCQAFFAYSIGSNGLVNFMDSSRSSSNSPTIQGWSFGDGTYGSGAITAHTYSANGVYAATLYLSDSSNACTSNLTDSIYITNVSPMPCVAALNFYVHKDSLNPQPGVWEISPSYSPQVTSAVWYWGDGSSTAGFYPSHTYTAAAVYNICVKLYAACGDSSTTCESDSLYKTSAVNSMISVTVINQATTGIKTVVENNAKLVLYPNPSAGIFTLSLNNVTASTAQINITNILGEVVYSSQEQVSNNSISKDIDLQNTANGAYFMKVSVGEKTYTNKIIISK